MRSKKIDTHAHTKKNSLSESSKSDPSKETTTAQATERENS